MTNMGDVVRLLKKEHDRLTKQAHGISAALAAFGAVYGQKSGVRGKLKAGATGPKRRKMSAAARKKIAAAQRLRWAKVKAAQKKTA